MNSARVAQRLVRLAWQFVRRTQRQDLVAYALMAGMVTSLTVAALSDIGRRITDSYTATVTEVATRTAAAGRCRSARAAEAPADPSVAAWAKRRLDESSDADLLVVVGARLIFRGGDFRELGRSYVERASRVNPPATQGARGYLRGLEAVRDPDLAFRAAPRSEWPGIVAKSAGIRKLRQLTLMAANEYGMAEYNDWRARQPPGSQNASPNVERDAHAAAEGFAHAKDYARQAIDLAASLGNAGVGEVTFLAYHTFGLSLLHEGDQRGAVNQMLAAAKLPAPNDGPPIGRGASWNEYKLVYYLLKNGERQTIIDYFERAAQGRDEARRKVMLASAAAIREGRTPEHYQYLLASGSI